MWKAPKGRHTNQLLQQINFKEKSTDKWESKPIG